MPKGRIGLSLDEDVLAILNECGRCEFVRDVDGRLSGSACMACRGATRTEIIQTAIREWYARQGAQSNGGAVERTDVHTDSKLTRRAKVTREDGRVKVETPDANVAPTYCPRHRPKHCELSCPHRVSS